MMKEAPKLSIVIPVFNIESYLAQCIQSVLDQSYSNLEVILVDDGSVDGSSIICQEFADKDKRIKFISQENGGVSRARNAGLSNVTGEWVMFVDGDDLLTRNGAQRLMAHASEYDIDCVSGGYVRFSDSDRVESTNEESGVRVVDGREAVSHLLYQRHIANGPFAKIYRYSSLGGVYFPNDISIAEDLYFNFQVLKQMSKIVLVDSEVYLYRQRQGSAMSSVFSNRRMDGLEITESILGAATQSRDKLIIRAAQARHFMEAVFVAVQIPKGEFPEEMSRCGVVIKKYQWSVIKDGSARLSHRLTAILSVISIKLMIVYFHFRSRISLMKGEIVA